MIVKKRSWNEIQNRLDLLDHDYVWFPDSNVEYDDSDIEYMFYIMDCLGLEVAHPSLKIGCFYNRPVTSHDMYSPGYRRTNTIERMAPAFSREGLRKSLPTIDDPNNSSIWPQKLKAAIIDDVQVNVTTPCDSSLGYSKGKRAISWLADDYPTKWWSRTSSFQVIESKNFKVGAEVGVMLGAFSGQLLSKTSVEKLYCVDYWGRDLSEDNYIYQQAKSHLGRFGERCEIIAKDSKEASFDIPMLDFVFIDAGHDYKSVKSDIETYWPKLKNGGLFFGHDYINTGRFSNFGVVQAVDEFAEKYVQDVRILGSDSMERPFVDSPHVDPFQCWWCIKDVRVKM